MYFSTYKIHDPSGLERSQLRSGRAYRLRYSTRNKAIQLPARLSPAASYLHLFALRFPSSQTGSGKRHLRELSESNSGLPRRAIPPITDCVLLPVTVNLALAGCVAAQNASVTTEQHYKL